MVQQHQVTSIKGGGGGGRDFRHGNKDDHPSKDRERRERFKPTKFAKMINRQKDKASTGQVRERERECVCVCVLPVHLH